MVANCQRCGENSSTFRLNRIFGNYCSFECSAAGNLKLYFATFWLFIINSFILWIRQLQILSILTGIIAAVFFSLTMIGYIIDKDEKTGSNIADNFVIQHMSRLFNQSSDDSSKSTENSEQKFIYIEDLGEEVRLCCYQTARLEETYCPCGRAIGSELTNYFAS